MPGRRQSAWTLRSFCQSVGHMGQNNNKLGFPCRHNLPPFPQMTDTNLFHFLFAVSYSSSPLIASILGKPSSLRGATVTVQDQEPYWRSVQPHPHPLPSLTSNRFCSLCWFGISVRMLIPKTANSTPADSTQPHIPRNNPQLTV